MRADIFGFDASVKQLEARLEGWMKAVEPQAEQAMKQIAIRWQGEAQERAPVDTGTLKTRVLANSYEQGGVFVTEVGSNLPYAPFVEFGTDYIAGGKVKALGSGPEITDAEAITIWPAKNAGIIKADGTADNRVVKAIDANLAAGGRQEQLPWLRPAFNAIRAWAIRTLERAMQPPRGKAA